jgi:hypothetical protein
LLIRWLLATAAFACSLHGQSSGKSILVVRVLPGCEVTILNSTSAPASDPSGRFLQGTIEFNYRVRIGAAGGALDMNLQPNGNIPGAQLSYSVELSGMGAPLTGHSPLVAAPLPSVLFSSGDHTSRSGSSGVFRWTLRVPASNDLLAPSFTPAIRCP